MEFITVMDLAAEIKVKPNTIRYWWEKDGIPCPVKYIGRIGYYPEAAETVRKFFRSRAPYDRV